MADRAWQREFVKRAIFGESMYLTYYISNHYDDDGVVTWREKVDVKPEFGVLSYPDDEGDDRDKLCASTLAFPPPGTSAGSHGYDDWLDFAAGAPRDEEPENDGGKPSAEKAKTSAESSSMSQDESTLARELSLLMENAPTFNEEAVTAEPEVSDERVVPDDDIPAPVDGMVAGDDAGGSESSH